MPLALLALALSAGPASPAPAANPLLAVWTAPFGLPPFEAIRPEHFRPAFEAAMEAHRVEVDATAAHPSPRRHHARRPALPPGERPPGGARGAPARPRPEGAARADLEGLR